MPPLGRLGRPLALAVGLLLAIGVTGWMIASTIRSLVYPAPPVRVPSPPPPPLEEVELRDGDRLLSAWWSPAEGTPRACLLLFHGNGENLETLRRSGLFAELRDLDSAVLAVDYPGYGRSAGEAREETVLAAGRLGLEALDRLAAAGCPRVVVGWSLGAAVALQTAITPAGRPPDALILLSPWSRLADVAAAHYPGWLVRTFLPERYDSVEAAASWSGPSLVIHGAEDWIIPVALGRDLFRALPEPKRWVEVAGAGHNDLLGRREVWAAMGEFLRGLS